MNIEVHYGGRSYTVAHTGNNINELREISSYLTGRQSEMISLELEDGGTLNCVVGPCVPFGVVCRR